MLMETNASGRREIFMLLTAKKNFYFLLVLCLILLILPQYLRMQFNDGFFYGGESYSNLRTAKYINENNELPIEDSRSYGGRQFIGEYGYPLLLSFNIEIMPKILPFLLGILSFILFYLILGKTKSEIRDIATLLFIISPSFLYLFNTLTKYSFVIFLILLGVYSYLCKSKLLSALFFSIIGFFSFSASLFVLLFYFMFTLYKKEKWNNFIIVFAGFLIFFLLQFYRIFYLGIPKNLFGFTSFNFGQIINIMFSDFGSIFGISLFVFILGIIGVWASFRETLKQYVYFFFIIAMFLLTFYFNSLVFAFVLIMPVFAAYGFNKLVNAEWKSEYFKYLVVLVLCCGFLFSTLAYINRVSDFTPSKSFGEGLNFLEKQEIDSDVFSHYSRGVYLSYAGKKNFMDSNFLYAPGLDYRTFDSERLLRAKDIKIAVALVNKYNIEYIWLDKELIDKLWSDDEIELLFLLRYSPETFEKVFDNGDVEIYKKK